ncbi:MAG TPA: acetyl-CoA carboxylase, carboxyltransferase subunit beta [Vicinamibacteria bacterium]|jgi:acetyl-CoA carboxylase carboxyl transferase subunit beta|nr:acetyl-CoA carboxylase, carboxyltransferase subunit beta [Vicinamibacteria bacterium]
MTWFKREPEPLAPQEQESRVPEGLWVKCSACKELIYRREVVENQSVCPKCAFHFRISARERLEMLFDGGWEELDAGLVSSDPLAFTDTKPYAVRLEDGHKKTASYDALVSAVGVMGGLRTLIAAMEYGFIGGSMGVVVGEKVTRAVETAARDRVPLLVVSSSGGARMMEGTLSLMQMAKITAALARLHEARVPFISLLTDPTTGGVTASYAMLGDLNVAEPGALIGFAGPRVIEQTIRQKLPEGFQRSEFLLEHGMLDMVVDRRELKRTLVRCFRQLLAGEAGA